MRMHDGETSKTDYCMMIQQANLSGHAILLKFDDRLLLNAQDDSSLTTNADLKRIFDYFNRFISPTSNCTTNNCMNSLVAVDPL